ncbi:MAG: lactate dehydrogenase [Rhizobiales bacterium 65-79]|nr:class I SAM-dependent DNA methyltransferase [Hyphomicrobiales bacterium]MBN9588533.1 class I SAM-dependent DNA methyltransferase [Alphaproteobacteria bacterium]OJU06425.1 MAG: lactate dehydrogenase [Rhizobiales bacterium 65-79]
MNAVEIEEAISALAELPFDGGEFPFAFLQAFGNKETTIKKLRAGETNKSDLGGVLQRNHIHIAVAASGEATKTLAALRSSPATTKAKARFILATDGVDFEAEHLDSGETIACTYSGFAKHFGFFLPLAGITTAQQIVENELDTRAAMRLQRLYIELLRDNPDWGATGRRHDMNHFMARLIFCFFAEDTDIFRKTGLFTSTVEQMSERDSSNTHEVIGALFLAMNTKIDERDAAKIRSWADAFPYVNGGLFSGNMDVPRFSRIARSYLLHIGNLDWKQINPDIFGSMIQTVADDEERGALGMHYTSVPNILKVLNPLFLDDLRARLEEVGDNGRTLLNLRKRMSKIRVFDPACGSGNFLVIAYKEMRAIEAEINKRRDEADRPSEIPLTNFRGIELRDFPAEIARLALIIAEFQCNVLYRGKRLALNEFLPLSKENWITRGNALRLDWLSVCPPTGTGVKLVSDDLLETPLDQAQIDFENEGGETYICGNPPYAGKGKKTPLEIDDMEFVFGRRGVKHGYIDYVGCWFMKAAEYGVSANSAFAFVTTNSLCQGHQVPLIWPLIFATGHRIFFAHTSFKWANLASNNAGVTVAIIGLSRESKVARKLFSLSDEGETLSKEVSNINAYLVGGADVVVEKRSTPLGELSSMDLGNMPYDGGNLLLSRQDLVELNLDDTQRHIFVRRIYGSKEFISNIERFCLWIEDGKLSEALSISGIKSRIEAVRAMRLKSTDSGGRAMAVRSHQMREMRGARAYTIIMPRTSSESRPYLPAGLLGVENVVSSEAFAMFDAPLWQLALIASRVHLIWIATTCGQLETRYRYSNVLGWNTFPVPTLTDKNKADLTRSAEDILLAREAHFPATIADLYDPDAMPADLREAHERNDEVLERIYIGRRFRNDTERLEKLFDLYTKMAASPGAAKKRKAGARA